MEFLDSHRMWSGITCHVLCYVVAARSFQQPCVRICRFPCSTQCMWSRLHLLSPPAEQAWQRAHTQHTTTVPAPWPWQGEESAGGGGTAGHLIPFSSVLSHEKPYLLAPWGGGPPHHTRPKRPQGSPPTKQGLYWWGNKPGSRQGACSRRSRR